MKLFSGIIIFLVIASVFALLRHIYYIKKCTIKVSAVVEAIEASHAGYYKPPLFYPIYRYKVEHWWYTARSQVEIPFWYKKPKLKIGDTAYIWVCPSNHKVCIPEEYRNNKSGPNDLWFSIIGTSLCILAIVFKLY